MVSLRPASSGLKNYILQKILTFNDHGYCDESSTPRKTLPMQVPDFLLIPILMSGEIWRRSVRRLRSSHLYSWRFKGSVPESLTVAPQDLRPADEALATEYYSGQFEFSGVLVETGGESPFALQQANPEWFAELHSFRWLRHLRAANTALVQANASAFITDWIEMWNAELSSDAWRSDIVSARLISWFSHAPLIVRNASPETYRMFLKSLARQTRYLHYNASNVRDGYPRLHSRIALAYASLCLEGREKTIRQAARDLDKEIERQILPDGGHISRNPIVLIHILADLLPLRQTYKKQGHSPSPAMLTAIDRMMAALRFFRHSNGDLAQFNGTGHTPAPLLKTILRYDDSNGNPQQSAPQSGYERLSAGETVVLVDTGKPTSRNASPRAMAGTLAFELSSGATRFISNCGITENEFNLYAPFARATAAHSTAVIDNRSSSHFASESKIRNRLASPLLHGPENVTRERSEDDGFLHLTASHDGYRPGLGIIHTRELNLADDGETLNGIDRFSSQNMGRSFPVSIRFHLPPTISASLLSSRHSILIAAAGSVNDAWTFTCVDAPLGLEESIQFSGPGQPRKSEQIVISTNSSIQEIRWTLVRRQSKTTRKSANSGTEEQEFLDLSVGTGAEISAEPELTSGLE